MEDIKNRLATKEQQLAEAEKLKDESTLHNLISSEFEGIDPHGRRINRDSFIQGYTSQDLTIESLDIEDVSIRIYDNIGIFLGRSLFKGAFKDQPIQGNAEFMDIWKYGDDNWLLVASQVTPIAELH